MAVIESGPVDHGSGSAVRRPVGLALPHLLLLASLAAAGVAQGGFYRRGQVLVGLGLTLVAVSGALVTGFGPWRAGRTCFGGLALLACTSLVSAVAGGRSGGAVPPVLLLAGVGTAIAAVASCTTEQRQELTALILLMGAVLGISGWFGVAFRVGSLAHPDGGLWRAATSLSYENAAAGVLAMLSLLALARLVERQSAGGRATTVVLLVGLAATLSRGGALAAASGLVVLLAVLGVRPVLASAALPLVGASVAAASLGITAPASHPGHPGVALVGLAVGVVIGVAPVRPTARLLVGGLAALGAVSIALLLTHPSLDSGVWTGRASASSPDRVAMWHAAAVIFQAHPVTGVGPGNATFTFVTSSHQLMADRYAHDEYLQLAAEQGCLGLAALAATTVGLVVTGRRALRADRRSPGRLVLSVGATAALAGFAVQSGLDFLWHVPSVALVAAVAAGLLIPAAGSAVAVPNQAAPPTLEVP